MKKIKIIPLVGIDLEGDVSIRFGQSADQIQVTLGVPNDATSNQLYYDDLEMRMDFDENNELEFIEFQGPFCEQIIPEIYKINPFSIEAGELVELLSSENKGEIDESEVPYSYCFVEISIGVWRESVEKDIHSTIEEMKSSGEYDESKDWLEKELIKSKFFWTIGAGIKNYYKDM